MAFVDGLPARKSVCGCHFMCGGADKETCSKEGGLVLRNRGTKSLETERLVLRQFRHDDAEDMFRNWASDPEVTEFLTWAPHTGVEITKDLLDGWIGGYSDPSFYNWVIAFLF